MAVRVRPAFAGPDSVRLIAAAGSPGLGGRMGAFRRAVAWIPPPAHGRTVAVIGAAPGAGASTAVAVLALIADGYTQNRVLVLDTNITDTDITDTGTADTRITRPDVGALLGGRTAGRLPVLLETSSGEAVARSRVRAASTPGTAVPVLALPPGAGPFSPQLLERTLDRLRYRADLILVDTPSDLGAPVFHALLPLAAQVLVVLPADRSAPARLAATRDALAAVPGPQRAHGIAVMLVGRRRFVPRWRPEDLPWALLRRDRAVARGALGRMSRRTVLTGLQLAALTAGPAPSAR